MTTNGFKIIAITPLKECDSKFLKNLQIGEVYKFYQEYDVRCEEDNSILRYYENPQLKNDIRLYNLKNGIHINISAVVGLNGSGKSSLIELLYYFIYKLATTEKVYGKEPIEKYSYILQNLYLTHKGYEEKLNKSNSAIEAYKIQNRLKLLINNLTNKEIENLSDEFYVNSVKEALANKTISLHKKWKTELKIDDLIQSNFNVGIVYESDGQIFSAVFSKQSLKFELLHSFKSNKKINQPNFNLENFFYSICLNFSHHSLNNKTLGHWINSLFHKNDAYTTPVVINPMRSDGNFDVNRELKLNNERLMSNVTYGLARNSEYKLLEKYMISEIVFTVKKSIVPVFYKGFKQRSKKLRKDNKQLYALSSDKQVRILPKKEFYSLLSVKMIQKHLNIEKLEFDFPFLNYAIGYLEDKIPKLKETYPQFFTGASGVIDEDKFGSFLDQDTSHITKKIRQTFHYLKFIYNNSNTIWESPTTYFSNHVQIEDFRNWLKINDKDFAKLSPLKLMDFAMPGFFNVNYVLQSNDNKSIELSMLSSGEQQMLFNINTIVYHLLNLQSIFADNLEKSERVAYKNVAVILDEIELYYHPEMQRRLINNTLNALEAIKNKGEKGIESLNICFLTHSPFILSDIPQSNIMHLVLNDEGKSEVKPFYSKTFAANINDLLAHDFFLDKSFMGEFAKEFINGIITKLESEDIFDEREQRNILMTIELIGEDLLRNSLLDLYQKRFNKLSYDDLLNFYNSHHTNETN